MAAKPLSYIPTLYFVEGLPFTLVNLTSIVFFKTMSVSNELVALWTSLFYIPWILKVFWAPLIDLFGSRRYWIVVLHMVLAIVSAALAAACLSSQPVLLCVILFAVMAFASATQDIAIDGYYMDVLDARGQAFYIGMRSAAYKVAWVFGSGALVYIAGKVAQNAKGGVIAGWVSAFACCALLFVFLFAWHCLLLPAPAKSHRGDKAGIKQTLATFIPIFRSFFDQAGIAAIIAYIVAFRAGDALLMKIAQPFLLDRTSAGGLGLSIADVGLIYGAVGTTFLIAGGIVGGWLLAKKGLEQCIWPFAAMQSFSILLYVFLSLTHPPIYTVMITNALEQFAYGLGTAAYTVFLLFTVKAEYRAAHYAMATALMALGIMLPGCISGFLSSYLGYPLFFFVSFLASLPGIIIIRYLPLKALLARRELQEERS